MSARSSESDKKSISPAQCRAGRGLIDMDQVTLAAAASVSRWVIINFEKGRRVPGKNNIAAIKRALEASGVHFFEGNGEGPGVRAQEEQSRLMTPSQCRAGRALVDLTQVQLASAAGVGLSTVIDFEKSRRAVSKDTLAPIRGTLESAGVIFVEENGPGVRLRKQR